MRIIRAKDAAAIDEYEVWRAGQTLVDGPTEASFTSLVTRAADTDYSARSDEVLGGRTGSAGSVVEEVVVGVALGALRSQAPRALLAGGIAVDAVGAVTRLAFFVAYDTSGSSEKQIAGTGSALGLFRPEAESAGRVAFDTVP